MSAQARKKKRRTHGMEMLLEQLDSEYGQTPPEKRSRPTGGDEDTGEPLTATSEHTKAPKDSTNDQQDSSEKEAAMGHILHRYWKAVSSKTKFEEVLRRLSRPWQLDNAQSLSVPSAIQRQLQSVSKFHFRGHPKQLLRELRQSHIPAEVIQTLHNSWINYARKMLNEVVANASTTGTVEGALSDGMKAKLFADLALRIDLSFAQVTINQSPGTRAYEHKSAFILVETKECIIVSMKGTGRVVMMLKRSLEKLELHLPDNITAVLHGSRFWSQRRLLC
eukprot:gb/GECG01012252.1/.p1 GENE.gb/GECG01012252.1/~~gb/GECG01012252.1/.p1  ORF type:complete len:278 (+),score=43.06 gb/GECG01012252.1/:1-834(+)